MNVGYARVSSFGQSLEIQLEQLNKVGCEKVFSEKLSGTSTNQRLKLKECIGFVRKGDVLIVTKLDRLARSTSDLLNIINELKVKGVGFKVLNNTAIDTTTASGRLMVSILGSIAEFENELRKERQSEGIARALNKGIKFGRRSTVSQEDIQEMKGLKQEGIKVKVLMDKYGLSKESIYRLLRS